MAGIQGRDASLRYLCISRGQVSTRFNEADADAVLHGLPVRKPPTYRGQRNYPGLFWSATTESFLIYESLLELDCLWLKDFDPAVEWIATQPFEMTGWCAGRSRRRKELFNPGPLVKALTKYWQDTVGISADFSALTCRFWAMYTGGDIRFVSALYNQLAMSPTETEMWRNDQEYRRTVQYHFNILAKEILQARGIVEPVIWRPQVARGDHEE